MASDQMAWLGCDTAGCDAEVIAPSKRITALATGLGWVSELVEVWVSEDEAGERWADRCPRHAGEAYDRWRTAYREAFGRDPWPDALAAARQQAGLEEHRQQEGDPIGPAGPVDDGDAAIVLAALAVHAAAWLLTPGVAQIASDRNLMVLARSYLAARRGPEALTLPDAAYEQMGPAVRGAVGAMRAVGDRAWSSWHRRALAALTGHRGPG